MNYLRDYLALWQTHCDEQQQFVRKEEAKFQSQDQIWIRQQARLLLEVGTESPRWNQLISSQIEAVKQLSLIAQIEAEAMITRQEQQRIAFTNNPPFG